MEHEEQCLCHDCQVRKVNEVELKGDDPVHDFLRILTKIANNQQKNRRVGRDGEE